MQDPHAKEMTGWIVDLLNWYHQAKRLLPWRQGGDPYRIWVSEVMLQQTRVEAVIPYYERFMNRFPTLDVLSDAPQDAVLSAWEGLGYYSRARHLHAAVQEVAERYGGQVPDDYDAFRALPGVGDYTAGAVLSIAYNLPVPAVDGNVLRVVARLFALPDNILSARVQKRVRAMLQESMPRNAAADFNQALMELGALVCKPKAPRCDECPVRAHCVAAAQRMQEALPVRKKKTAQRAEYLVVVCLNVEGKWLVRKRPARGLLAGLWEFPNHDDPSCGKAEGAFAAAFEFARQIGATGVREWQEVGSYTHVFSHLTWQLRVFTGLASAVDVVEPYRLMAEEERNEMAFAQVFAKILKDVRRV